MPVGVSDIQPKQKSRRIRSM